jgi:hypothetical protein
MTDYPDGLLRSAPRSFTWKRRTDVCLTAAMLTLEAAS